jgi:hypothetical protein
VQTVSEIIDRVIGSLDEELVSDIFWPEDTEAIILSLPVQSDWDLGGHASLVFYNKCLFTAKSAYKVFREVEKKSQAHSSGSTETPTEETCFWRNIWMLPVPGKIKHFVCRLARNTPALRANLRHRVMKLTTECVVCGAAHEDGTHLYYKCN